MQSIMKESSILRDATKLAEDKSKNEESADEEQLMGGYFNVPIIKDEAMLNINASNEKKLQKYLQLTRMYFQFGTLLTSYKSSTCTNPPL